MHRVQSSGLPKTANPGVQGQTVGKSLPGDLSVAGEQFPVTRTRGPSCVEIWVERMGGVFLGSSLLDHDRLAQSDS
jgi:hypothetical protein